MTVRIGVVPEDRLLDRVGSERDDLGLPEANDLQLVHGPSPTQPSGRQPAPVREEAPEAFWLATGASVLEQGIARVRRGTATSADGDSTPVAEGNFCPDRATRW